MSNTINIKAGDPIGYHPVGTQLKYGDKPLIVEYDTNRNCLSCGFYDSDPHSQTNCQLLEVDLKTFCGETARKDAQNIYYKFNY